MPSSPTPLPEPQIAHYLRFLKTSRGLRFEADTPAGYDALWRWSIDELPDFWASIWQHFDVRSSSTDQSNPIQPVGSDRPTPSQHAGKPSMSGFMPVPSGNAPVRRRPPA